MTVECSPASDAAREQDRSCRALADGGVDILIGTHRLLQKDVQFQRPGLLVVDEEQRFGVSTRSG